MRRVAIFTLLAISLLVSAITLAQPPVQGADDPAAKNLRLASTRAAVSPSIAPCVAPSSLSDSVAALVTNLSSLTHWQRLDASRVNATRQMGLLQSLTSFDCRHPFVEGGNTSLTFLAAQITGLGLPVQEEWFPVMRRMWNGFTYVLQPYWTRNLYVCPWGVNATQPSLVVTCHVDSVRSSIIGIALSAAPGADDDAAGVAAVFEALQVLATQAGSFEGCNVVFAFLGGEEGNGTLSLWGSRQLVGSGFSALGLDPSAVLAVNIDEIAYRGMVFPAQLAVYRYPGEEVSPVFERLQAASSLLNISLVDMARARVETAAEVQNYLAWSTSEWTFHTHGIPSITLSTDQYPDPYKHSTSDVLSRCATANLQRVSKLLIATILSLAFQVPQNQSNAAAQWIPHLAKAARISVVDYVDYSAAGAYAAQVLDPELSLDASLAAALIQNQLPTLGLGKAGVQLVHQMTGASIVTQGTHFLAVSGLRAFHPAIASTHLMEGETAAVFRACPTVYAVNIVQRLLVLVGNDSWCAMGYYEPPASGAPLVFLGVEAPVDEHIAEMAAASLSWLLGGRTNDVGLGIDKADPVVGDQVLIYVLTYDFAHWLSVPDQSLLVTLRCSLVGLNSSTHVVTNASGVATLVARLHSPTALVIAAHSVTTQSVFATLEIMARPVCTAAITYQAEVLQGELLRLECAVLSSWVAAAYVNLTLGAPEVGEAVESNLLLLPGLNIYRFSLAVLPYCPPENHSLVLVIGAADLVLSYDSVALRVNRAFTLILDDVPVTVLQQEPFWIGANLTNRGSVPRVFEIVVAEANFQGACQVTVPPNNTVPVSCQVVYLPWRIMDTGPRLLTIELRFAGHRIDTDEAVVEVRYSQFNFLMTLVPPVLLAALCVLGLFWMRKPSHARRRLVDSEVIPTEGVVESASSLAYWGSRRSVTVVQSYPYSRELENRIARVSERFGLQSRGPGRFYSDNGVLVCERQREALRVTIMATNRRLVQRVLADLPDETESSANGDDSAHDDLD